MELLKTNALQNISVRQICNIVGINRSTFYTHYASVYDLWAELDSLLRIGQIQYFDKAGIQLEMFLSEEGIESILYYIHDYRNFYSSYLSLLGSTEYINAAFDELWNSHETKAFWDVSIEKEQMYHAFSFFMGGALHLILFWLSNDCNTPIPELAKRLYSYTPRELRMK